MPIETEKKLNSQKIQEAINKLDENHKTNMGAIKEEIENLKKSVTAEAKKTPEKKAAKSSPKSKSGSSESAPGRVDAAILEKLKADLDKARTTWLSAEFKYKTERSKISKLTSFLVGDKSKLGNTKLGKKMGVDNEKYVPVEKTQTAYHQAYMEYRIAQTADRKAELAGRPEDEIELELKKLGIEDSDAEYNQVQAERGQNIVTGSQEQSTKRSEIIGKALTIGKQGALGVWTGIKMGVGLAGKVYNKAVDKIDHGKSVNFKIPWGKDTNGDRKYVEYKYRIGKLVISTALAGLTVGGPEMWIRIARSLTIAVGSGLGLNYVTKKHEAKMALLADELADIETKALNNQLTPAQYGDAKKANEDAVRKSNKRFNLTCYALLGGAVAANLGSAYGLEKPGQLLGGPALEHAEAGATTGGGTSPLYPYKPGDLTRTNFLKGYIDLDQPNDDVPIPLRKGGVEVSLTDQLKASNVADNNAIQSANTTSVDTANVVKNPLLNPIVAPADSVSADTAAAIKNPIVAPVVTADSTAIDSSSLDKAPIAPATTPEATAIPPVPEAPQAEIALEVKMSSKGALETVRELKASLKHLYPDPSKAPENIQHILKTDYTTLTKEWGLYKPEADTLLTGDHEESAWMRAGDEEDTSKLMVGTDGRVTLHNFDKGDTILSGESATTYHDQMFDSNGPGSTATGTTGEKFDISHIPEGEAGPASTGTFDINHIPDGEAGSASQSTIDSTAAPKEAQDWIKNHPGRALIDPISGKVVDPETGRPYSDVFLENNAAAKAASVERPRVPLETDHQRVVVRGDEYRGKLVTFEDDKILVDGKEAPKLTEKYEFEKIRAVEKIGPNFTWTADTAEKSTEWANIRGKELRALASPSNEVHETFKGDEEKYIKKLLKVARDSGIDATTFQGTADQLVEEIALRKLA